MKPLPEKSLVSIIMPVYNAGDFLLPAIRSILSQSYPNFELLICDDNSSDTSLEVIQNIEDERIELFKNETNQGYLKTCNRLFKEAKGDIITFQDADDWSKPDRLKLIVEALRVNPEAGVSLSNYKKVNESGALIEERNLNFDFDAFANDANYWTYFCGASIAIRKEVYKAIGGYHPYFDRKGGEDYDWLFRICRQFKGVQIKQSLYTYRIHESAVKKEDRLERYYILDLVNAGRRLMIEEGRDYLAPENAAWLNEKEKRLKKPFQSNPSHLLKIRAVGQINSGKPWAAFILAFRAWCAWPFSLGNLFSVIRIYYLAVRKLIKL